MLKELFFKKASEKEDRDRIKKRYILGGFGIGKLLAMGLGSATAAATLKLKSNFSDLEDILSYKEKHNLQDIPMHYGKDAKAFAAYSRFDKPIPTGVHSQIVNAPIVVHELAHARQFRNNPMLKGLVVRLGGPMLSPTIATAATINKVESPEMAAAIPFLAASPTLISEGHANLSALKHMISRHGFKEGISKSKLLFPAMATYTVTPAVISAAAYYLKKKQLEKRKNA